jgi:hypothetical protein
VLLRSLFLCTVLLLIAVRTAILKSDFLDLHRKPGPAIDEPYVNQSRFVLLMDGKTDDEEH